MKTILLVDDEIYARDHLGRVIEKHGFGVYLASTGEEAIEIYEKNRPDYVFLDIILPGIDGDHVFNHIKNIDPDAKIYFISGRDNIVTKEEAIKMGAKGFLDKPIMIEDILELIKSFKE